MKEVLNQRDGNEEQKSFFTSLPSRPSAAKYVLFWASPSRQNVVANQVKSSS